MGGAEADNTQIKFLAAPCFEAVAWRQHQAGTTGGQGDKKSRVAITVSLLRHPRINRPVGEALPVAARDT